MSSSEKRAITAEDLYAIQLINEPQLSPNGQTVIFSLLRVDHKSEKKHSNLWVVSVDEGSTRQFTYGDQSDRMPRWSPDGETIAFLSNRKDSQQDQLYLLPFNGGEARPLTELKGVFGRYSWSPDGTQIVCTFRKKDTTQLETETDEQKNKMGVVARHITRLDYKGDGVGFLAQERWHLWVINIATGKATQLTDSEIYDELEPCWSPDGAQILFRSNRSDDPDLQWDDQSLFLIPAAGGEIRRLETPRGSKGDPIFSPDGHWVAYYSYAARNARWQQTSLCVLPVDGHAPARDLTAEYDFDVTHYTLNDSSGSAIVPPTWRNDSRTLYFQASQHGSTTLKSISINGDNLQEVVGAEGAVGHYQFDETQTRLAYFRAMIDHPGQVWVRDMHTGTSRQLTTVNQALFNELDLGTIDEVWYENERGMALQGWVLKPPAFDPTEKYPAIIEIHGGPMGQYGHAFMHEFYFLAAQGYIVCYTNPRGGRGYGVEHTKAIYNQWGTADYADMMTWTDWVASLPYVDETRLGVTGGSYGGFMTNWIISHTQRFKAAVTQRCVSNFISMYGSSDLQTGWQALFGAEAAPWEDWENYWQQSPLKHFGNVKTPTLVIHSEQDLRCTIEQGEQVFVALKVLGVDAEMIRFPDESHGLSRGGRTDRRIVRLKHILRWFDKYLKTSS